MDIIVKVFNLAGSLVCHQLPSRTLSADGIPLPICARDTGIYLGFFVATVFIILRGRFHADKPPDLPLSVILCAMMLPMMVDGAGSYLGITETNNTARLLTGAFFGLPLPFFLIPAANFRIYGENIKKVLGGPVDLIIVILLNGFLCILVMNGRLLPYLLLSTLVISSFIFMIVRIAYTIIARLKPWKGKYCYLTTAGAAFCFLSVLYLISTYILQPLKAVLM